MIRLRPLSVTLAAASALLVLSGCGPDAEGQGCGIACLFSGSSAAPFVVAKAEIGDIVDVVPAIGPVRAASSVEVGAEIGGRVVEVLVDFNSAVTKDQILARIDPAPYEAAVRRAEAQLATAEGALAEATARLGATAARMERLRILARQDFAARAELEAADFEHQGLEAARKVAAAGVKDAQARLDDARLALERTTIRSPITGFVLDRRVQPGQVLNALHTTPVLFTIAASMDEVFVDALVSEADIGRVAAGMVVRITVDAYPGMVFDGVSTEVRRAPVREGRLVSYPVIVRAANPDQRLLPGMTASVEFVHSDARSVLRVPIRALYFQPQDFIPPLPEEKMREVAAAFPGDGPFGASPAAIRGAAFGAYLRKGYQRIFIERDGKLHTAAVRPQAQDAEFVEIVPGSERVWPADVDVQEGDRVVLSVADPGQPQ